MIDLLTVAPRYALAYQRLTDLPGALHQLFVVVQLQFLAVVVHEKEPIAAPGHVACHRTISFDFDSHRFEVPVAGDVADCHFAGFVKGCRYHADRSFNAMLARLNAPQVGECGHDAYGPVPAHPDIADVVEEDHPRQAGLVPRFGQQCPDEDVGASRFADHGGTERVV